MNSVRLAGKVSRVKPVQYTPAGDALCEFTLAVPQTYLNRESIGYFEVMVVGELAEGLQLRMKIGKAVQVEGKLWMRAFKNRQGNRVTDTKIFVEKIEESP